MATTTDSLPAATTGDRARHVWFPLAVIAAAVGWWLWRAAASGYTTIFHVLVVLGTAALLSAWYARFGWGVRQTRKRIVRGGWLAFIVASSL